MKGIKHECQLMESCNHGERVRECGKVRKRCDSSQRDVNVVRNLFQLMGRCDGHGGGVMG